MIVLAAFSLCCAYGCGPKQEEQKTTPVSSDSRVQQQGSTAKGPTQHD